MGMLDKLRAAKSDGDAKQKKCWDFCTHPCVLKQYDLCPTDLPDYQSPPPNTGAQNLTELKIGKQDYEPLMDKYSRKISEDAKRIGYKAAAAKHGSWRQEVAKTDPFAMMLIYNDPKIVEAGKSHYHLPMWFPEIAQEIILMDPAIMSNVMIAVSKSVKNPPTGGLVGKLNVAFRNSIIPECERRFKEIGSREVTRSGIKEESEYCLSRLDYAIYHFKRYASAIVARWLFELSFSAPEFWLALAGKLNEFTDAINIPDKYSKTGQRFILKGDNDGEVVKSSAATSSFTFVLKGSTDEGEPAE